MRARLVTEENKKWWTLAAVSFGLFMIMLDNTVVNVALPSIQRDLGVGLSELEWIVSGYALTFAALMLIGGKLADAYGRRLLFVIGIAVFTLASLACGLSTSGEMLIAARVAQGAGAALMNPATLSIIAATFPPKQRGTAIGIWAGVSALALAIGPLVGGLLTDHASWHWIFFVNIPVGIVGIAASFLLIDESRDPTHERLDLPGLVTSAVGLFALTYGLIEANTYGWGSARIVGSFVVAAVSLVSFVVLERRQRAPMLDLTLFREPHLRRREYRRPARCARDVRRVLLRLALHAERSRLLRRRGGRRLPADDGSHHPRGAAGGPAVRPLGLARADDGRDAARGRAAPLLQPARRRRHLLGAPSRPHARRSRNGDDDDPERRGRDARRPGREVRRRLGRC